MSAYEKIDEQKKFACRVIADHARATAFSIADGILPANEGRNYVLRKIMRRAIYQGRHTLGFEGLFFHKVTNFVVDQMGEAYPELETHRDFIDKMVRLEEERFGTTLTVSLGKLESEELEQAILVIRTSKTLAELDRNYNHLVYQMGLSDDQEEWIIDNDDTSYRELQKQTLIKLQDVPEWEESIKASGANVIDLTPLQEAYEQRSRELARLLRPFARLYDTYGTPR